MCLEKVTREFGAKLTIKWKSYLLRPYPSSSTGAGPSDKFRRYTQSWQRPAAVEGAPEFRPWATDNPQPSHSLPAQVAVKAAARQGAFDRYHMALMRAYFYENRTITDDEVIMDVARAQGLDLDVFTEDLKDTALPRQVAAEYGQAQSRGVTAVPTVVVDDGLAVPGAQTVELYRHVINKRLATTEGA